MNTELKNEVATRVNRLGDNELILAYSKAETKDANTIVDLIDEFRRPFADGKVTSMGSAAFANPETWAKIAEESDSAARRELLKSSAVLTELDELERRAREAQAAADQKNRELNNAWAEYSAIPERIEAINARLADIANELASLDTPKLNADFKSVYRNALNGAIYDPLAQMQLAGLLVTAPLRKEVLNELATELKAQLIEVQARSRTLGKKLGQRS